MQKTMYLAALYREGDKLHTLWQLISAGRAIALANFIDRGLVKYVGDRKFNPLFAEQARNYIPLHLQTNEELWKFQHDFNQEARAYDDNPDLHPEPRETRLDKLLRRSLVYMGGLEYEDIALADVVAHKPKETARNILLQEIYRELGLTEDGKEPRQ